MNSRCRDVRVLECYDKESRLKETNRAAMVKSHKSFKFGMRPQFWGKGNPNIRNYSWVFYSSGHTWWKEPRISAVKVRIKHQDTEKSVMQTFVPWESKLEIAISSKTELDGFLYTASQLLTDRGTLRKLDKAKQLRSTDLKAEGGNRSCRKNRRKKRSAQVTLKREEFGEIIHGWFLAMQANNVWKQGWRVLVFEGDMVLSVCTCFTKCTAAMTSPDPTDRRTPSVEEQKGGRKSN